MVKPIDEWHTDDIRVHTSDHEPWISNFDTKLFKEGLLGKVACATVKK